MIITHLLLLSKGGVAFLKILARRLRRNGNPPRRINARLSLSKNAAPHVEELQSISGVKARNVTNEAENVMNRRKFLAAAASTAAAAKRVDQPKAGVEPGQNHQNANGGTKHPVPSPAPISRAAVCRHVAR